MSKLSLFNAGNQYLHKKTLELRTSLPSKRLLQRLVSIAWLFFNLIGRKKENSLYGMVFKHFNYTEIKQLLTERGFDPRTSGLWAQHASTAPLCY